MPDDTRTILFVCTGNIFRSMTAEHALRHALGERTDITSASAGTHAMPQAMRPEVLRRLLERGIDPTGHVQRQLKRTIVDEADVVVCMGLDHRQFVHEQFGLAAPLFGEVACGIAEPVLDIHEAVLQFATDPTAAEEYAVRTVDFICDAVPGLLRWLEGSKASCE